MQVQSTTDGTVFASCKGIRCHGDFTRMCDKHKSFINLMENNPVFKEFGKQYDYIAHFERDFGFTYTNYLFETFDYEAMYKLFLTPIFNIRTKMPSVLKKIVDRLCGSKNKSNVIIEEKGNIVNLPTKFTVCETHYLPSEDAASNAFARELKGIDIYTLKAKLNAATV